ncbi:uncharacterized protein DNG_07499 [Cephalotrichum gorgonifer]|uniref:Uncharacterized protein n=1 Tax=Cephalotrichum gorgonifer TaxID=2041049 RepID=A0AAE8SXJ3_9PEZI|nr:uncharacterized protein DNG_07499 [Cephalotrichum gorgonifer]
MITFLDIIVLLVLPIFALYLWAILFAILSMQLSELASTEKQRQQNHHTTATRRSFRVQTGISTPMDGFSWPAATVEAAFYTSPEDGDDEQFEGRVYGRRRGPRPPSPPPPPPSSRRVSQSEGADVSDSGNESDDESERNNSEGDHSDDDTIQPTPTSSDDERDDDDGEDSGSEDGGQAFQPCSQGARLQVSTEWEWL